MYEQTGETPPDTDDLLVSVGGRRTRLSPAAGGTIESGPEGVRAVPGFEAGADAVARLRFTVGRWFVVDLPTARTLPKLDGQPIDGSLSLDGRHTLHVDGKDVVVEVEVGGRKDPDGGPPELGVLSGTRRSESATRYMSAAAYLDDEYTRAIVEHVVFPRHRGVAPSHGFDPTTVLRHCFRARRRMRIRGLIVVSVVFVVFVSGMVADQYALAYAFSVITATSFIYATLRSLYEFRFRRAALFATVGLSLAWANPTPEGAGDAQYDFWRTLGDLAVLAFVSVTDLLATIPGLGVLELNTDLTSNSTYGIPQDAGTGFALGVLLPLLLLYGVTFGVEWANQRLISREFGGSFDPDDAPVEPERFRGRVREFARAGSGEITLYRPGGEPAFEGYGDVEFAWSWAVPLHRAATPEAGTRDLDTRTLDRKLADGLKTFECGRDRSPLTYAVSVGQRAFVDGLLPRDHHLLRDPHRAPRQQLGEDYLEALQRRGSGPERLYHTIQFVSWDGESVLTCLVHVDIDGPILSVEFLATALAPIHERFRTIDTAWRPNVVTIVITLLRSTWLVPRHVIDAIVALPLSLLRSGMRPVRDKILDIQRRQQAAFDFAPVASIRQLASSGRTTRGFRAIDHNRQARIVERLVVENLGAILEDDGYDPSVLEGANSAVDPFPSTTDATPPRHRIGRSRNTM